MPKYEKMLEFQKRYPTKVGKARALNKMTDKQIDALIQDSPNVNQKIWLASFKSDKKKK